MKKILHTLSIVLLSALLTTGIFTLIEYVSNYDQATEVIDIKVDFDHWYQGYFYWHNYMQSKVPQQILDMDIIVNFDGIWCHHNTEKFFTLYQRLEVGDYCKLDGNIFKVIEKTTGYADKGYHYDNGEEVPFGTDCYITTCQDETGYGIYIAKLEKVS